MSRRYDGSTTTFDPEGRIKQIEYAVEAIRNAGSSVGITGADCIVLAGEVKKGSTLVAPSKNSEKMYKIDDHIAVIVAGLTSDANILINELRVEAQRHLLTYQEPQPVEHLVRAIANWKQSYTMYGGNRPFGVSFLYAGYDATHGFQLYCSDPSGNYGQWKATAVGANDDQGKSVLKANYADDMSEEDCLKLAVKTLSKTMDTTAASADRMEFAVLSLDAERGPQFRVLEEAEAAALIESVEAETATEGDV